MNQPSSWILSLRFLTFNEISSLRSVSKFINEITQNKILLSQVELFIKKDMEYQEENKQLCSDLNIIKYINSCNITTMKILEYCTNLHTLDISYCKQITSINPLRYCLNLHTLDMSFCRQIKSIGPLQHCL